MDWIVLEEGEALPPLPPLPRPQTSPFSLLSRQELLEAAAQAKSEWDYAWDQLSR